MDIVYIYFKFAINKQLPVNFNNFLNVIFRFTDKIAIHHLHISTFFIQYRVEVIRKQISKTF